MQGGGNYCRVCFHEIPPTGCVLLDFRSSSTMMSSPYVQKSIQGCIIPVFLNDSNIQCSVLFKLEWVPHCLGGHYKITGSARKLMGNKEERIVYTQSSPLKAVLSLSYAFTGAFHPGWCIETPLFFCTLNFSILLKCAFI